MEVFGGGSGRYSVHILPISPNRAGRLEVGGDGGRIGGPPNGTRGVGRMSRLVWGSSLFIEGTEEQGHD
jgi:hypothetical protein